MTFNMLNEDFFEMLVNTGSEGAEGVLKILDDPARWLYKDPATIVINTTIKSDSPKERLNLLIKRSITYFLFVQVYHTLCLFTYVTHFHTSCPV